MSEGFLRGFEEGWVAASILASPVWVMLLLYVGIAEGEPLGVPLAIAWSLAGVHAINKMRRMLWAEPSDFVAFWIDASGPRHA